MMLAIPNIDWLRPAILTRCSSGTRTVVAALLAGQWKALNDERTTMMTMICHIITMPRTKSVIKASVEMAIRPSAAIMTCLRFHLST
jgi:hypothetical protein